MLYVLEFVLVVIVGTFLLIEVIYPLLEGRPLFPMFRLKATKQLGAVDEAVDEELVRSEIVRAKKKLDDLKRQNDQPQDERKEN